jgi:DNA-binding transcriptional MerR regulator
LQLRSKGDEKAAKPLRPVDLARSVGISASLVRTYERVGFLPAADRSPTGYRRYTGAHVEALRVARCLIAGYGWQPALSVMRAVHAGDIATALAVVDARHADLHRQRAQIDEVLGVLEQTPLLASGNHPTVGRRRVLRVGPAAQLVGVRPSALRFWEQHGLLSPARDAHTRMRSYDQEQIQRAQTVALLRAAGYRFDAIREVLDDVAANRTAQARAALEQRRQSVTDASRQAMSATSTLDSYLRSLASTGIAPPGPESG